MKYTKYSRGGSPMGSITSKRRATPRAGSDLRNEDVLRTLQKLPRKLMRSLKRVFAR